MDQGSIAAPEKKRTYGDTGLGNGGSGVVLGGENVAGSPGNLGTENSQGLDQDGGLDGHVEGTGNAGTLEDLGGSVLLTKSDETGHLVLGELDLLATESGKADISCKSQPLQRAGRERTRLVQVFCRHFSRSGV